jgi:deoxyhypusine synthase
MTEPNIAKDAVLQKSTFDLKNATVVKGYDFNKGVNYEEILKSFKTTGFQATNMGSAIDEINKMLSTRNEPLSEDDQDKYEDDEFIRRKHKCTIFMGYTSNIVSSGLRETLRFLVQHKLVDCIVTTAGKNL